MSQSDNGKVSNVSRRGMLKWAGALAAVGVVGIGLGFGGDILIRPNSTSTATQMSTQTATQTATQVETQATTVTATQIQTETATQPALTQTTTQTNLSTATVTATKNNTQTVTQTATQTNTQTVTQPAVTQTITTTSVQQPTTLSYVPPLSPTVQTRVNQIIQDAISVGNGETITYLGVCGLSCMTKCVVKAYSKNGVLTRIEGDDSVNPTSPREDVGMTAINNGQLQSRPCALGIAWPSVVNDPNRLLYPMQQVGPKGSGQYARITWTQALDTIYQKLVSTVSQYGPYSVWGHPLVSYVPAGMSGWGANSYSGFAQVEYIAMGCEASMANCCGAESDILNSKLVILVGRLPDVIEGQGGAWGYYLQLAKEAGIPFILIDPRYTVSHHSLNAQWIAIKPGTDVALFTAMAYVLFNENLYNQAYVTTWVEPTGFAKWKAYVMGTSDGVPKSPQWAESLCGVPAATIQALAELYAKSNPARILCPWEGSRSTSSNFTRAAYMLPMLMGYTMVNGGGHPFEWGYSKNPWMTVSPSTPTPNFGAAAATNTVAILSSNYKYQKAILNRAKLDSGALTAAQYNGLIGNAATAPTPNIRMMCNLTNSPTDHFGASERVASMKQVWSYGSYWTLNNSALYMDIILPNVEVAIEEPGASAGSRIIVNSADLNNVWVYSAPASQPLGETRPVLWVNLMLAKRFGLDQKFNPVLASALAQDEWDFNKWNNAIEGVHQTAYNAWASNSAVASLKPPSWTDFKKKPVMRYNATQNGPFQLTRNANTNPFSVTWVGHTSKQFELYSNWMADPNLVANTVFTVQRLGGADGLTTSNSSTDLKVCWGTEGSNSTPLPMWADNVEYTWEDPNLVNYPLLVITCNSYYRSHSAMFNNKLLHGDCYKHRVWISVYDAAARGIKDNDLVRIYSDTGEMYIPAYVTSRMTPGVVAIYHAGQYAPNGMKTALMPDGIDVGGNPNFLLKDQQPGTMVIGPVVGSGPCQVELAETS